MKTEKKITLSVLTFFLFLLIYYLLSIKENYTNNKQICIYQTYKDKSLVPQKVYDNIKKYAPGYKHIITDDEDNKKFIFENYGQVYLDAYNKLENGAHKADLWRYLILYKHGGVYLDIKTELITPIDEIFVDKNKMYLVEGSAGNNIYNGIMYSPPNNPIYFTLIQFCLNNIDNVKKDYMLFVREFHKILKDKVGSDLPINKVININGLPIIYINKEKCNSNKDECADGLDKWGLCCYIYGKNDKKIFKTRYSDYPWNEKN